MEYISGEDFLKQPKEIQDKIREKEIKNIEEVSKSLLIK